MFLDEDTTVKVPKGKIVQKELTAVNTYFCYNFTIILLDLLLFHHLTCIFLLLLIPYLFRCYYFRPALIVVLIIHSLLTCFNLFWLLNLLLFHAPFHSLSHTNAHTHILYTSLSYTHTQTLPLFHTQILSLSLSQRQAAGLSIIENSCNKGEHDSCYLAGSHYVSHGTYVLTLHS